MLGRTLLPGLSNFYADVTCANQRLSVYCRIHFTDRVRWAEHVARMGERSGGYRGLVGRYEGKQLTLRQSRRWEGNIKIYLQEVGGRDSAVGVAGSSGDRVPVGTRFFRACPDQPWGPPSLLYSWYRFSFLEVKRPGRDADHPPHLVPRLKKE